MTIVVLPLSARCLRRRGSTAKTPPSSSNIGICQERGPLTLILKKTLVFIADRRAPHAVDRIPKHALGSTAAVDSKRRNTGQH